MVAWRELSSPELCSRALASRPRPLPPALRSLALCPRPLPRRRLGRGSPRRRGARAAARACPKGGSAPEINYSPDGVVVKTDDGWLYEADYVMVSVSLGVLQSNLIRFTPPLPDGPGTEFFLYASNRRGYYPVWQHLEKEYPGSNILLVTVTDDESRRIEQLSDEQTKAEAMEVLTKMFPDKDLPDATDILVPRWWSDRFFKGSFSIDRYEYDLIRAPVGRVYFTGEHTSEHYNGYVHGAYLSGMDSADILIK